MPIPPSPELLRRYRNTDEVVKSGKNYLIPDLATRYPNDYIDIATYEAMKRSMGFI